MPEYKGTKATRHGTKGPFRYRDTESLRHPSRWVTCEMKRSRGRLFYMGLCLGAFVGLLTILPLVAGGCAEDHSMRPGGPRRASLLLGSEATAFWSTHLGRSEWPATSGRIESPEQTIYVEYYRDFQSNAANEINNPYREFQSYRIGATQR